MDLAKISSNSTDLGKLVRASRNYEATVPFPATCRFMNLFSAASDNVPFSACKHEDKPAKTRMMS